MASAKSAPFMGLHPNELEAISDHALTRAFPKNTVVITEGDRSDSLYIILSGKVKFYVSDEQGKEIILSEAGPGEYFGEISLDDRPRSASVMTLEPTRFSIVPKDDFRAFLARSPEFAFNLIGKLIHRVRELTENVKSLGLMDVYGRVAHMLVDLAEDDNGQLVIADKPTQQDMANRIGASREMISKILKDLEAGGYIIVDSKRIVIAKNLPRHW
jgi:CRP/FNR family transcriptional regulator, cyclic AMP receptor protein